MSEHERKLLEMIVANFLRWRGKPHQRGQVVWNTADRDAAIRAAGESFSAEFVISLCDSLENMTIVGEHTSAVYGADYLDPDKTKAEKKRAQDLKGFKTIRQPGKGGSNKKKDAEEREARAYWDRWQDSIKTRTPLYKSQDKYIDDMREKLGVSRSTMFSWIKLWKK